MFRQRRTQLEHFDGTQTSPLPQMYRKRERGEATPEEAGPAVPKRNKVSGITDEAKLRFFNQSMRLHLENGIRKIVQDDNKLAEYRQKSQEVTKLPPGLITKAEDLAHCKPNEIRKYLEQNAVKESGEPCKPYFLWREFVAANLTTIRDAMRAALLAQRQQPAVPPAPRRQPAPAEDVAEEQAIEQERATSSENFRTCTVFLPSIIRNGLTNETKVVFHETVERAMGNVSNYISDFQFIIHTLINSFKTRAFTGRLVDGTLAFNAVQGFETRTILPPGFAPHEAIPFSAPPLLQQIIISDVVNKHLRGLSSDQHLNFIHSSFFGSRGTTETSRRDHPFQELLNNGVSNSTRQLLSDKNAVPVIMKAIALNQYVTNFSNMWKKGNIYSKVLNKLIDILLKVHLAPIRHQAYREYVAAKEAETVAAHQRRQQDVDQPALELGKLPRDHRRMIVRNSYNQLLKYTQKATSGQDISGKWQRRQQRCYNRTQFLKRNIAQTRATPAGEDDDDPASAALAAEIMDIDPLVLEEAETDIPMQDIVQEEDLAEAETTDLSRRRLQQLKGALKDMLFNAEDRQQITEDRFRIANPEMTQQEIGVCLLIFNSPIPYIPPADNRFTIAYQIPFILLANDLLRCCGYPGSTVKMCPNPKPTLNSVRFDSTSIFQLFCSTGDIRFRIFDFGGEIIDSIMIARSCKDAMFNSFFSRQSIEDVCNRYNLDFAHNVTILPGMKYVKILGTKRQTRVATMVNYTNQAANDRANNNLPWEAIVREQLKQDDQLRDEIEDLGQRINELDRNAKAQARRFKDNNFSQQINILKRNWHSTLPLTEQQFLDNNQTFLDIENVKRERQDSHQTHYDTKQQLSQARYDQFIRRKAISLRNSTRISASQGTTNARRIVDKSPFVAKAERVELNDAPHEIGDNYVFSGTDNGIVKMNETVQMDITRFRYHLRLYNRFAPLADVQDPTVQADIPFIPLPKPFTVHSGDIDLGGGHYRLRKKLERDKRATEEGREATRSEQTLSTNNLSQATTQAQAEVAYRTQIASRGTMRYFYDSTKRARLNRKKEILDDKFRNHLCTRERGVMRHTAEGKKHLVMFIGDRGTGVGSRIKGHRRYGGKWKQEIHGRSTTTCITNENKTSQTCVYCFHPLSHPTQQVVKNGRAIVKSINGAFICYNQDCVTVRNNRNVQTRDSVSAMAIALSGLATILFNQTFPQFSTTISQSNTEFKNKTTSFLTRSEVRAARVAG